MKRRSLHFFPQFLTIILMGCFLFAAQNYSAYAVDGAVESEVVETETEAEKTAREAAEKVAKENEERKEKEEDLKDDAKKLEEKLSAAEKEKNEKQKILNVQYNELNKKRYAVEQTRENVEAKDSEITATSQKITSLEGRIELNRASLRAALRQLYYERSNTVETRVFETGDQEQFLFVQESVDRVRAEVIGVVDRLDQERDDLQEAKKSLEDARLEQEALLTKQKKQEAEVERIAAAATADVRRAEATISEINGKLAGIQSKLSSLLGTGLTTDDIVEAAEFASGKTGVRKGFLLGMLIVETDLGRFTGGCTYKESRMNERRKVFFKKLTKELDYDHKKMKVSCPPSNYSGTGGAMGVAQFMSDTWYEYKDVIAKRTGNNPPDPWNLVDGVMAMASKLANDGARSRDGEWNAAARYLGSCRGNTKFYCENVLYWADNYEKKL